MGRKERKKCAEEKRHRIGGRIIEKVSSHYKDTGDFPASLNEGDRLINNLIRESPQDKTLIILSAERVKEYLVEAFKEQEKKAGHRQKGR